MSKNQIIVAAAVGTIVAGLGIAKIINVRNGSKRGMLEIAGRNIKSIFGASSK